MWIAAAAFAWEPPDLSAAATRVPSEVPGVDVWRLDAASEAAALHEGIGDPLPALDGWAVRARAEAVAYHQGRYLVIAPRQKSRRAQEALVAPVLDRAEAAIADDAVRPFLRNTLAPIVLRCTGDHDGPADAVLADPCVAAHLEGRPVPDLTGRTLTVSRASATAEARRTLRGAEVEAWGAAYAPQPGSLWEQIDALDDPWFLVAVGAVYQQHQPDRGCGRLFPANVLLPSRERAFRCDWTPSPAEPPVSRSGRQPRIPPACPSEDYDGAPVAASMDRAARSALHVEICDEQSPDPVFTGAWAAWRADMAPDAWPLLRELVHQVRRSPGAAADPVASVAALELRFPRLAWILTARADAARDADVAVAADLARSGRDFETVVVFLEASMAASGWGRTDGVALADDGFPLDMWTHADFPFPFARDLAAATAEAGCTLDPRAPTAEGWTLPWREVATGCTLPDAPVEHGPWPYTWFAWRSVAPALAVATPEDREALTAWLARVVPKAGPPAPPTGAPR